MLIPNLETMGNAHAREILVAADELGKVDEQLENAKRASDFKLTIELIKKELPLLDRIGSVLDGKKLFLVEDLRVAQGKITAKIIPLHEKHKQLKLEQKEHETQKELGIEIRELDHQLKEIQELDAEIVSGSKRDISTLRLIMQRAGRKLDVFGWFK
ncbi:MAG: hypothetical protein WC254_02085 [Candidatus Woesearchaeota archaeon]|jgi:hypothetical protein